MIVAVCDASNTHGQWPPTQTGKAVGAQHGRVSIRFFDGRQTALGLNEEFPLVVWAAGGTWSGDNSFTVQCLSRGQLQFILSLENGEYHLTVGPGVKVKVHRQKKGAF